MDISIILHVLLHFDLNYRKVSLLYRCRKRHVVSHARVFPKFPKLLMRCMPLHFFVLSSEVLLASVPHSGLYVYSTTCGERQRPSLKQSGSAPAPVGARKAPKAKKRKSESRFARDPGFSSHRASG